MKNQAKDYAMPRRAYSYKRFSSPKQAHGDSIRRQTAFEQQIVKEMDLLLDDSLDLSDTGVSAFRGKNSKFGTLAEFLKLVESGQIAEGSVLIVENIDRLSRENVFDAFNLFSRIIGAGITLVTAEPRDVYDKAAVQSNVAKLMVPLVYMMRAHDESLRKSHLIHQAWNSRRKRATEDGVPLTERCPRWLRVVNKKYEVIENRARVIRDIYRWAQEGMGIGRIVKQLIRDRVPSFGTTRPWHRTYVRKLLTWPAVYGEMQPHVFTDGKKTRHGQPVANYFPAVISKDEYLLVREALRGRAGKEGRPATGVENLFAGIVWHAGDRVKMAMKSHNGAKRRTSYLRSNMCDKGLPAREGRQFPYEKFEEGVLSTLMELKAEDVSDQIEKHNKGLSKKIEDLRNELVRVDNRRQELEAELADPNSEMPAKAAAAALSKLETRRNEIAAELSPLQAESLSCRTESLGDTQTLVRLMRSTEKGPNLERLRRKVKTRLRWLLTEVWVHIEKINHIRQYAHVQLFLRSGVKKNVTISSFDPAPGRKMVPPRRDYSEEDFRTYVPTATERAAGRGKLAEALRSRKGM